jgi:hypothetical protein
MASSAPVLGQGFDAETRKSFNAVFDAMSTWRDDLSALTEKNSDAVFEKMSAAAKKVGWPENLVDATRQQMQQASKIQLHMLDQVMDAWQQQVKSPSAMVNPADYMKNMPQWPGMPSGGNPFMPGNMPNFGAMGAGNPMQFWMQAAEMWQKSWTSAMDMWTKGPTNGSR